MGARSHLSPESLTLHVWWGRRRNQWQQIVSKSVKGFLSYRGPKIGVLLLTWLVAFTTVRHYRADCDWVTVYAIGPLSCLSVLSVTLVYCCQTVGWIKMKLGMEVAQVGFGPGHIVLDGVPAPPPQKGHSPQFGPIFVVVRWLDGSRCHLARR